jgi:hypothetical protein
VARITFQKRQKEMKRLEKARMKAERRAQRKLTKGTEPEIDSEIIMEQIDISPMEPEPQDVNDVLNPS